MTSKSSTSVVVLVLAAVFMIMLPGRWVWGVRQHMVAKAHHYDAVEQTVAQRVQAVRRFGASRASAAQLAAVTQALPAQPDLPGAIAAISAAAQSTGVHWVAGAPPGADSVLGSAASSPTTTPTTSSSGGAPSSGATTSGSTTAAATGSAPTSYKLDLSVSGTMDQVMAFADALRNLGRLVVVTNLSVSPSGAGTSAAAGAVSANLSALLYTWRPSPPPLPTLN